MGRAVPATASDSIASLQERQLESDSWPGGDDTGGGAYDSKPTSSISTSAGSMPVAADEEEKTPECDIYLNESAPAHSIPFRKRSPVLEVLEVEPVFFRHFVSLSSMINVTSAMRREITKLKECSHPAPLVHPELQPDPLSRGVYVGRHPPRPGPRGCGEHSTASCDEPCFQSVSAADVSHANSCSRFTLVGAWRWPP